MSLPDNAMYMMPLIVPSSGRDTWGMNDRQPRVSPSEKRVARAAAREGHKIRLRAIEQAMLAGWADLDADELNWMDEAARAHPGPDFAVHFMYGLTKRLVERLAEATGEDREQVLRDVLR